MRNKILLYTDGASKGNPGSGGWGALTVLPDGQVAEYGAGSPQATNNQMELTAVIEGIRSLAKVKGDLLILTDSSYVIQGIQKWVKRWQSNNWRTVSGQPVSNQALWQELVGLTERRKTMGLLEWQHVYGHVGIPGNEKVDSIADAYAKKQNPDLFIGRLEDYGIDPYKVEAPPQQTEKKSRSKKQAYSYLSLVNGEFQKHKTWKECEARVKGRTGAKFKKALSPEDEFEIMKVWKVQDHSVPR